MRTHTAGAFTVFRWQPGARAGALPARASTAAPAWCTAATRHPLACFPKRRGRAREQHLVGRVGRGGWPASTRAPCLAPCGELHQALLRQALQRHAQKMLVVAAAATATIAIAISITIAASALTKRREVEALQLSDEIALRHAANRQLARADEVEEAGLGVEQEQLPLDDGELVHAPRLVRAQPHGLVHGDHLERRRHAHQPRLGVEAVHVLERGGLVRARVRVRVRVRARVRVRVGGWG